MFQNFNKKCSANQAETYFEVKNATASEVLNRPQTPTDMEQCICKQIQTILHSSSFSFKENNCYIGEMI